MVPTRSESPQGSAKRPCEKEFVMCHTSWARCAPRSEFHGYVHHGHGPGPQGWGDESMGRGFGEEGGFGVRRPLRFLAYKLGLDEKQVAELARVLDDLKTERAQVAVDDRRTLADFA